MSNVAEVEIRQGPMTWGEYRRSVTGTVADACEIILGRTSLSVEELDALDVEEAVCLYKRVADAIMRENVLHAMGLELRSALGTLGGTDATEPQAAS